MNNVDAVTVAGFGDEWDAYDQAALPEEERWRIFDQYFSMFPFDEVRGSTGFDLGCGSGRWALCMAPRVGLLHCIDPAAKALDVARRTLAGQPNVRLHLAHSGRIPLEDGSQDFGYALGVLHHAPDPTAALADAVAKLRPGAPFLVYLYYRFDNRPAWFRGLWHVSNLGRRIISRLPFALRKAVTAVIAATVYWPLARLARGPNWPLGFYRDKSFYTMRTDALDRFGTRLEHRFTRPEIEAMMRAAGLTDIRFRDGEPYWVAIGRKA